MLTKHLHLALSTVYLLHCTTIELKMCTPAWRGILVYILQPLSDFPSAPVPLLQGWCLQLVAVNCCNIIFSVVHIRTITRFFFL